MAKKIKSELVEDTGVCVVCGSPNVQIHHVIYGTANREISDRLGYIIPLCMGHHTIQPTGIHFDKKLDYFWKAKAQKHFESNIGNRRSFIELFGRSYL